MIKTAMLMNQIAIGNKYGIVQTFVGSTEGTLHFQVQHDSRGHRKFLGIFVGVYINLVT